MKHPLKNFCIGHLEVKTDLAGRLAQLAMEEMRAETGMIYKFIAVRLPYGVQADEADASKP